MITRRAVLEGAGAALVPDLRRDRADRLALWRNRGGPRLRGAVFAQRRVYRAVDGELFLGEGVVGPPITDAALDALAEAGANLAVWSGPGHVAEGAPFDRDAAIEDHIGDWLERCRARGLYTVIAFRSGPGRSAFAFNRGEDWYPASLLDERVWFDAEPRAAWVAMVEDALSRFGPHRACAGVLAMVEPNPETAGAPARVWTAMAERLTAHGADPAAPLILSPPGWADVGRAVALGRAGADTVLGVHDWTPRAYTHEGEGPPPLDEAGVAAPALKPGAAWACLEFGGVVEAQGFDRFLAARIESLEAAGANWAAWRWTTGWAPYEAREHAMNLARNEAARAALRAAFQRNTAQPG